MKRLALLLLVSACSTKTPEQGPQGPTGPRGDVGPRGDPGVSVTVNPLAAGADCATGGIEVLSPEGRRVVCNGAGGSTSVTVTPEDAGTNCSGGGVKLTAGGIDSFVCNGGGSGGGLDVPRLSDGGILDGGIVYVGADGGLRVDAALFTYDEAAKTMRLAGDLRLEPGAPRTIGVPQANLFGTNVTVRAGGTIGSGGANNGGVLELRAGNSNLSGAATCGTCDPTVAGACPGPGNNSVKIYAGDNAIGQGFACNNWYNGDIEFYAGNGSPEVMRIVGNSQNVGIGTPTPTQKLQVAGNVLANNVTLPSDARLKYDIRTLKDARDVLAKIRGVRYRYNDDAVKRFGVGRGEQIGLIAQDVQAVAPEAVIALPDGTLTVSYERLVPVLVEALKADDARLDRLEQRLKALEKPAR